MTDIKQRIIRATSKEKKKREKITAESFKEDPWITKRVVKN